MRKIITPAITINVVVTTMEGLQCSGVRHGRKSDDGYNGRDVSGRESKRALTVAAVAVNSNGGSGG